MIPIRVQFHPGQTESACCCFVHVGQNVCCIIMFFEEISNNKTSTLSLSITELKNKQTDVLPLMARAGYYEFLKVKMYS